MSFYSYKSGTIAVTNGSTVVVGTSTLWSAGVQDGDQLMVLGSGTDWHVYEISVTDDTDITLDRPYNGATGSALSYMIFRNSVARDSYSTVSKQLSDFLASYRDLISVTGNDRYFTLNKATSTDNAGLLLQQGGVSLARAGLFGDNSFHLQWLNGATWTDALLLSANGSLAFTASSTAVLAFNAKQTVFTGDGTNNTAVMGVSNGTAGFRIGTFNGAATMAAVDQTLVANFTPFQLTATSFSFLTGALSLNNTIDATSPTTGSFTTMGGVGIARALNVGTSVAIGNGATGAGKGLVVYGDAHTSTSTGVAVFYSGPGVGYGALLQPTNSTASATATPLGFCNSSGTVVGTVTNTNTTTAFNTSSDQRLKEDPQPFDGMAIINGLKPYNFAWKASGSRAHGVFAQEAQQVFAEAVYVPDDPNAYLGVDYAKFVPPVIRAIQQLDARVAALESAQ